MAATAGKLERTGSRPKVAARRRQRPWLGRAAAYVGVLAVVALALFPFYWIVITSIKPADQLLTIPPTWWPVSPTLEHYARVWSFVPISRYMLNSLAVAVGTTAIGLAVATPAGYALSRYNFRGNIALLTVLLFSQLIPGIVTLVPFYFLTRDLGLHNSRTGLVFAYAVWSVPFATLMLRSYLKTAYPREIEESALIDGCTRWGVFWRIALPLAAPGIAATGAFSFLLAWNEYMWAAVIITEGDLKTLPLGLRDFTGQFGVNPYLGLWMTAAVLATLPVIVIFAVLQRYMVSGLTSGSVKG
jgi:multiple sugar transport system permease protein